MDLRFLGVLVVGFGACAGPGTGTVDGSADVPSCGNGMVDDGEICDIAIPVSQEGSCVLLELCGDADPCTVDTVVNADPCNPVCGQLRVVLFESGDGCCPAGGTTSNDSDCVASGSTIWMANTTPPGGGSAASGGCRTRVTGFDSIGFDVTVRLDVGTDGNNNYSLAWTFTMENTLLGPVGGTAAFGSLGLNAIAMGATSSVISSRENPDAVGLSLNNFLTGNVLTLRTPGEITAGSAVIAPGASGVSIGWDGHFELNLTLDGSPLAIIDDSECTFNVQGSPITFSMGTGSDL